MDIFFNIRPIIMIQNENPLYNNENPFFVYQLLLNNFAREILKIWRARGAARIVPLLLPLKPLLNRQKSYFMQERRLNYRVHF